MSTRLTLVAQSLLLSAFFSAAPALAQDKTSTGVESFEAIKKEFDEASANWMDTYRSAAKDGASKEELSKLIESRPTGATYAGRAIKVLEANAANAEGAETAVWLVRAARVTGAPFERALEILREHHVNSDSLKNLMLSLSRNASPATSTFLTAVLEKSDSVENQARACFALAEHLKTQASAVHKIKAGDKDAIKRYTASLGRETVDILANEDPAAIEQAAGKRYEQVINSEAFAVVERYRSTLGNHAKNGLFELRNLSIGKTAPDIIGEDIDGTPMKLSDYRGKVVVIDFWGDW